MKTIFLKDTNTDKLRLQKPSVATIGFFDGVHLGHQFLINRLAEMAKQDGQLPFVQASLTSRRV